MNIREISTKLAALCTLASVVFLFSACASEEQKRRDQKWIADRAAFLCTQKNPETGKQFTPKEALNAAEYENRMAALSTMALYAPSAVDAMSAQPGFSQRVLDKPVPTAGIQPPHVEVCPTPHH